MADQTTPTLGQLSHTYASAGEFFPIVTVMTSAGQFSSAGGWNGDSQRLRINVQSAPGLISTISVTDPVDIKWTPDGNLYVLSQNTPAITEYNSAGMAIRSLTGSAAVGLNPTGLDVDAVGNVYVAVTSDNQVKRFLPSGGSFQIDTSFNGTGFVGRSDKAAGSGSAEFSAPFDVAVTPDGKQIAIADSNNHRIQRITTTGRFVSTFGGLGNATAQFNTPKGLAYDSAGYLYIVDSGNNRVTMADSHGRVIGTTGSAGNALGQFQGPVHVAIGSRGIYVAETANNRVQVLTPVTSQEGTARLPLTSRLALSTQLTLTQPNSVTAVEDLLEEKIYIADRGNNRVILVTLPSDNPTSVWSTAIQFLSAGDVSGAMPFFSTLSADDYRQAYLAIGSGTLASIMSQIPQLTPVFIYNDQAQYYFQQTIDEQVITFTVDFVKENGTWKIDTF